ncbi:NAD(+) synthase [Asticcacaulis benevestitus]|uniref:Glutamine-dependent NAD(+) synthetase n=1 Tax=Asticcacaulis benevestitus DSM 16100 = ATCC BAA-896 TaxID=1121022 RepID=V4PZF4_9CAUL|nr:NAD(+) synthase [Asticcacaulis benevestitus]ESQ93756.1 NAD synthetase [Asticcacaulis benevestitus DSM 16100 = ATCC BAA-896]
MTDEMQTFLSPATHGFVRIACVTPKVHIADPQANLAEHISLAKRADEAGADLVVFPELSLSAYAIDDLFTQEVLLESCKEALEALIRESENIRSILIVGVPLIISGAIYNCAAILHRGNCIGIVPKTYLPNYREYYEKRYFASGSQLMGEAPMLKDSKGRGYALFVDSKVPVFRAYGFEAFSFGVEICEDVWSPVTPSTRLALNGATIIVNLSASPVVVGKSRARKRLCAATSERLICCYAYSAAGPGESTTDLAWDGQSLIYEMGDLLAEGERFTSDTMTLADIDVNRIIQDRLRNGTFNDARVFSAANQDMFRTFSYTPHNLTDFHRSVPRFPYVPADKERLDEDCYEAFNIQVHGLMQRLSTSHTQNVVIGISGGLDSTHAVIVACKAFDRLGIPRTNIHGYTMPGFGTSTGSRNDALKLMKALGISSEVLDIRPAAKRMLLDIGHPFSRGERVYDVNFENVQAGLRTDFLFRLAGEKKGFVVGTGDLSELALGWCTYGVGDHMSHYNVNCGAPKTLIQHLIRWAAAKEFDARTGRILQSVLEREISPELVPIEAGVIQRTEDKVGPYELQDFNLYYITRYGLKPSKVAFLSYQAWKDKYTLPEIRKWLELFLLRFFTLSQFKRSAVPNGPKLISGGALSPRGDWRAPSDGNAKIWLDELKANVPE